MTDVSVQKFQEDGFLQLKGFLPADEVAGIREALRRIFEERWDEVDQRDVDYKGGRTIDRVTYLMGIHRYAPRLRALRNDIRLKEVASALLGVEANPMALQFRCAVPDEQSQVHPHQDVKGPNFHPADGVTFWFSLGDYDEDFGCLRYVRGSHKNGFQPLAFGPLPNPDYDSSDEVACPTKAGDVLVHHSMTLHRSAPSRADVPRWALMLSFARADAERISDQEWNQIYNPTGYGRSFQDGRVGDVRGPDARI